MLTVDHVLARRRGDRLQLLELRPEQRQRLLAVAAALIEAAGAAVGESRAAFEARCAEVDADPRDRRVAAGLQKLVTDRCEFAAREGGDPVVLRQALFEAASRDRQQLPDGGELDREGTVQEVASAHGLAPAQLEELLFSDLKQAQLLTSFAPIAAEPLLAQWELGQAQAALLKAVQVTVDVESDHPAAYRALFRKLKFHRLLFVLHEREGGGYRLEIDGPFSLFRSVTKYGLQLALLLPVLTECCAWRLRAQVLWGRERRQLELHLAGGRSDTAPAGPPLSDDLARLVRQFEKLECGWSVRPSAKVLHLPGEGLCVADLEFGHEGSGCEVLLEVLGYWSRDAVWRRVELVEKGLRERVVFAVSDRLRVSEAVLGDDLPGSLYVYKGQMNARRIAERLEDLRQR